MTGLYNSFTTKNLINEKIKNTKGTDALIIIDCDKFKSINDNYGHLQGDKVVVNIGEAMSRSFRKSDIMGRIGGDEFCVYMPDIPSADFAVSKCREFMESVKQLTHEQPVTVSIGLALLKDEKSYEDLFVNADKALYEAKKKGGSQIRLASRD